MNTKEVTFDELCDATPGMRSAIQHANAMSSLAAGKTISVCGKCGWEHAARLTYISGFTGPEMDCAICGYVARLALVKAQEVKAVRA